MSSLVATLASIGTAFTALSAGVYFIAKALINKSFEAGLERYKLSLQQELEAHKMTLQRDNYKFTKLHELQCSAIKDVYLSLDSYQEYLKELERFVQEEEVAQDFKNKLSPLLERVDEVDKHYRQNKIILNEQIARSIQDVIQVLYYASRPLLLALIARGKDRKDTSGKQLGVEYLALNDVLPEDKSEFDSHIADIKEVNKKIDAAMESLATEFRKVYGAYQA